MLSFAEKSAIVDAFPELEQKKVSLGRLNYHFEESAYDKKIVVYHLHPNGNGFVYAGHLDDYDTDDKGFVNIREFSAEELKSIIERSIRSLATNEADLSTQAGQSEQAEQAEQAEQSGQSGQSESVMLGQTHKERWTDENNHVLDLYLDDEDQMWYIYAGENLDTIFEYYEEAAEYLAEEGFSLSHS
ncbi:hypothetical protein [Paenibacillus sp. 481]|uniref:hypothetical protein n=1 Tax=Paenibacillus sp. 481 TaxID=2835869 RepID=UPI001E3BA83B|nr:hypothetical protein [Paenibacillus sp. 481]UHA75120.1 hypothetical protein KIK04_08900 [Paenibacillus sp. 481]